MKSLIQTFALCVTTLPFIAAFTSPINTNTPRYTTPLSAVAFPKIQIPNLSLPFFNTSQKRSQLKSQILSLAAQTRRGLTATPSQQKEMESLFIQLEQLNPTSNPLRSINPSVNGDWDLQYTTSDAILGKGGFPRIGPIVQNIDTTTLSAKNSEVVRYVLLDVPRSVTAELSPVNGKLTNVQFKQLSIGPAKVDAPESFRGSLDVTYLDEEMRLTRGDKGNLFVLTRM